MIIGLYWRWKYLLLRSSMFTISGKRATIINFCFKSFIFVPLKYEWNIKGTCWCLPNVRKRPKTKKTPNTHSFWKYSCWHNAKVTSLIKLDPWTPTYIQLFTLTLLTRSILTKSVEQFMEIFTNYVTFFLLISMWTIKPVLRDVPT